MSLFTALKPGDRVTLVNGAELPAPLVVLEVSPDGRSVRLEPPARSVVEWRLYADQHDVTVERPQPVPPRPRKPRTAATRTVGGVRLVSKGDGWWESEDGAWSITREEGQTTCDDTHPVRITAAMRRKAREHPAWVDSALYLALLTGRDGYVCEGGGDHTYVCWVLSRDGQAVSIRDTFAECAAEMTGMLG